MACHVPTALKRGIVNAAELVRPQQRCPQARVSALPMQEKCQRACATTATALSASHGLLPPHMLGHLEVALQVSALSDIPAVPAVPAGRLAGSSPGAAACELGSSGERLARAIRDQLA